MEGTSILNIAKGIFGTNFIGVNELEMIKSSFDINIPENVPEIPFGINEMISKKDDYLLLLGVSNFSSKVPMTLENLRLFFGINPNYQEPCFYNQDWYLNELFFKRKLETKWLLIRKSVFEGSRGKDPDRHLNEIILPYAIECAYSFFIYWLHARDYLWKNDYVWCKDVDKAGDRIYVGRYFDPLGISKNGFSIHRHLKIRDNYGNI